MNLLLIDSGHAKNTAGKKAPDNSMYEWEFNDYMQYKIKKRAEDHNIEVALSNPNPSTVKDIGLTDRANIMNNYWKSKNKPKAIMISLHANAYGNDFNSARGTETFIASNASQNSKNAAKYIQDEIVKTMKSLDSNAKDRGVKVEDFTVIYKTITPCCLIEYAFYSNKEDLKILKNNRDELVEATIKGICKYFDITYKPVTDSNNPSETDKFYKVCLGAFKDRDNAVKIKNEAMSKGFKDAYMIYE